MSDSTATAAVVPSIGDLYSCADALFDVPDHKIHLPYHAVVAQADEEESQSVGSFGSISEPGDLYNVHRGAKYSVNGEISDKAESNFRVVQPNCTWKVTITPRSEDSQSKDEKAFFDAAGDRELLFSPAVSEGWNGSEPFAGLTMNDFQPRPMEDGYVTDYREDSAGLEEDNTENQEATNEDLYNPYQSGYTTVRTEEIVGRWGVTGGTVVCDGAANLHARLSVLGPSVPLLERSTSTSNMPTRALEGSESPENEPRPQAKQQRITDDDDGSTLKLPEIRGTNSLLG